MIWPVSRKNRLTFGGDPVPDTDSGSLFFLHHQCSVGHFRRFISSSHTVAGCLNESWRQAHESHYIFGAIRHIPGSGSGSVRKSCKYVAAFG